jgi:cysteine synthase
LDQSINHHHHHHHQFRNRENTVNHNIKIGLDIKNMSAASQKKLVVCGGTGFLGIA